MRLDVKVVTPIAQQYAVQLTRVSIRRSSYSQDPKGSRALISTPRSHGYVAVDIFHLLCINCSQILTTLYSGKELRLGLQEMNLFGAEIDTYV